MNKLILKIAITVAAGSFLSTNSAHGQILPPAKRAENVKFVQAPALELAHDDLAVLRWTTTNPRGDDEHFAVAHYGTDPGDLSQMAKSHIRLNRSHPETNFRVRLTGLKSQTTYYYWVTSMDSSGTNDGVKSTVCQFTTPAPGKRVINHPNQRNGS